MKLSARVTWAKCSVVTASHVSRILPKIENDRLSAGLSSGHTPRGSGVKNKPFPSVGGPELSCMPPVFARSGAAEERFGSLRG